MCFLFESKSRVTEAPSIWRSAVGNSKLIMWVIWVSTILYDTLFSHHYFLFYSRSLELGRKEITFKCCLDHFRLHHQSLLNAKPRKRNLQSHHRQQLHQQLRRHHVHHLLRHKQVKPLQHQCYLRLNLHPVSGFCFCLLYFLEVATYQLDPFTVVMKIKRFIVSNSLCAVKLIL